MSPVPLFSQRSEVPADCNADPEILLAKRVADNQELAVSLYGSNHGVSSALTWSAKDIRPNEQNRRHGMV